LVALFFPVSWLFRLPHILTQIEQDGIRFWTWRGKQFVAWSEFVDLNNQGLKLVLRTAQKTYLWNLQSHKPKIAEEYFELIKTRVPMNDDLRIRYQEFEAEKQNGIDYSDWPIGEAVSLPIETRVRPLVFVPTFILAGGGLVLSVIIWLVDAPLELALLFGALSILIIIFTIPILFRSITIDDQGVQVRDMFARYAITWPEVEFVANNNFRGEQQLLDLIVLEGSQKRLSFGMSMSTNKKRFKQAVLQKMRAYQLPLKPIEPGKVKLYNVKI
jgi:hypothetical protein